MWGTNLIITLPLLGYCSSVWSPYLLGDIQSLESVQRLFTRRLPGYDKMSYKERLCNLGLPTLELRRLRSDLVLCYKILYGITAGDPKDYGLILAERGLETRGHDLKLSLTHCRVNARLNYFGSRISKVWNSLPQELVHASNAVQFKRGVLMCDLHMFLKIK